MVIDDNPCGKTEFKRVSLDSRDDTKSSGDKRNMRARRTVRGSAVVCATEYMHRALQGGDGTTTVRHKTNERPNSGKTEEGLCTVVCSVFTVGP
ncbi:unnamed protein product [Macrosiphum euphorbiae]|uniref:Uncharacterized protein n=1 Tax=Macrosiphum euphorbiae TaxID=13131 RepID=A0AAV0XB49_9HEMI|nr:unnamed protein product [Macrosiphum euphorbiae]